MHKSESTKTERLEELARPMKCLHSTVNDALTLDAGRGANNVEWSVDSAFGVHPDFKSHVQGAIKSHVQGTMGLKGGKGSPMNILAKQKPNTESSTVTELAGVDCALSLALWGHCF